MTKSILKEGKWGQSEKSLLNFMGRHGKALHVDRFSSPCVGGRPRHRLSSAKRATSPVEVFNAIYNGKILLLSYPRPVISLTLEEALWHLLQHI